MRRPPPEPLASKPSWWPLAFFGLMLGVYTVAAFHRLDVYPDLYFDEVAYRQVTSRE